VCCVSLNLTLSLIRREFARELIRELKNKSLEAGTVLLKAEAVDAETERLHKDITLVLYVV
jgi:hypothetical protein